MNVELFSNAELRVSGASTDANDQAMIDMVQENGHIQITVPPSAKTRVVLTTAYVKITTVVDDTEVIVCHDPTDAKLTCHDVKRGEIELEAQGKVVSLKANEASYTLEGQPTIWPPICEHIDELTTWIEQLRNGEDVPALGDLVARWFTEPCPGEEPSATEAPPTQSAASIAAAMVSLVDNTGVPEAAAYDKSQPAPHRLLLLTQEGELYSNYFDLLPDDWKPSYVSETELVAMITFQQTVMDTQRYHDSAGNIYVFRRIREDFYIRLKEAKTGKLISEKLFMGQNPPPFQNSRTTDEDLVGNPPTVDEIKDWLKTFVNP